MEQPKNSNNGTTKVKMVCRSCKRELNHRIPRPALIKFLLPWVDFKNYKCTHCLRTTLRVN